MGKFIDMKNWHMWEHGIPDSRFTVIEKDDNPHKDRGAYWKCQCQCGNFKIVKGCYLRNGSVRSCGCLQQDSMNAQRIDMTGWRMNEHNVPKSIITVLEYDKEKSQNNSHSYWKCRCDCGTIWSASGYDLRKGNIKSCGCKSREFTREKLFIDISNWIMKEHNVPDSKLTVINFDHTENSHHYWLCKCECGREKVIRGDSLKDGSIKTCGECAHIQIGEKFNKLTVIDIIQQTNGKPRLYKCKCDCGNITMVESSQLRNDHTKSCGCLIKNAYKQNNLIGKRFGKLLVKEYIGPSKDGEGALYLCKCDCGNEIEIRATRLRYENTQSCGCVKSIGENNIIQILKKENIEYIYNRRYFEDLIGEKGGPLRYDFILIKNKIPYRIIEFDGEQHTKMVEYFGGEEYFEIRQKYDKIKNEYALSHNIPLVRIPYWERDNITLEMIMGDKYLVKENKIMEEK